MPTIEYLPDGKKGEVGQGDTILQAALQAGVPLTHICGGHGRCSTCRVLVLEGLENCAPRSPREQTVADLLQFSPAVRLACQTEVNGPVKVRRLVLDEADVELSSLVIGEAGPSTVGKEKEILILFADIRGFTAFAETLLPYDVIHVLNRFFHQMGKVITRHGGEINAYMGDGLMALFEAEDPADGALRAVRAGLDMQAEVEKLKPYLEELYQRSFAIRIGLHYGQVVAGSLGTLGNRKHTVIGDAVNFASRIEAANKEAGTRFLMSADCYRLVRERVRVGRIVNLQVPGKTGSYTLYEITGLA